MRPFVLIAAIRRTGSTLVAEALSDLPRAFVLREPKLFRGRVALKPDDIERLRAAAGVDLAAAGGGGMTGPEAAQRFCDEVARPLSGVVEQVGIKEIRYGPRWPEVLDVLRGLAPLRVVALGRDPRDMYLSLAHRSRVRRVPLQGAFGPEAVAADIAREFGVQQQLIDATDALAVRYEDLCSDPDVLARIRRFVDSPVGGDGLIGAFKTAEHAPHGGTVTALRVHRWHEEPDAALRAEADDAMRRLDGYCEYWGYPR